MEDESQLFFKSVDIAAAKIIDANTTSDEITSHILRIYRGLKNASSEIRDLDSIVNFKSRIVEIENPATANGKKLNLVRVKALSNNAQGSKYGAQNLWLDFANPRFQELLEEAEIAFQFGEEVLMQKKTVPTHDGSGTRSFFEGAKLPPTAQKAKPVEAKPVEAKPVEREVPEHVKAIRHRVEQLDPETKKIVMAFIKENGLKSSSHFKEINEEIDRILGERQLSEGKEVFF